MNTLLKVAVFAAAFLIATPAIAGSTKLFNTVEFQSNSLEALPQWQRALAKIERERQGYAKCARNEHACGSRAISAWQGMIRKLRGSHRIEQLDHVNRFINQWQYRPDRRNYGRSDYWASPGEFFSRSGDCEDYAIAKYVTLRQMGFSADQLRLVVVNDTRRDIAHAVLAAYVGGDVYILDNLSNQVRSQSVVSEYAPYYSVNEKARWAHKLAAIPGGKAPAGGLSAKTLFSKS